MQKRTQGKSKKGSPPPYLSWNSVAICLALPSKDEPLGSISLASGLSDEWSAAVLKASHDAWANHESLSLHLMEVSDAEMR